MPRGFESHRLRQRQHPAGCCLLFCGKLCKGCKVGFEQPVPGALRPAGLQQSCGLLQGRGESHRLRQGQHPAGAVFILRQTMQGLQGGIRTARARRFASRRAATVLRTVAKGAGESHRLRQEQRPAGAAFYFAANYARAARWDSNSPCPALCVPPGCNSPADCCKGAGESHRLRQVSLLNSTLGSDFCYRFVKSPYFSYKHLPFIFK